MSFIRQAFGQGPKVSLFTLGTMRALSSIEQMYEVVEKASFVGINHIETAPTYGLAEKFLGEVFERLKRNKICPQGGWVITSKILPGVQLDEGKEQIKQTLLRLGVQRIDNLAVHGINLDEHLEWALHGEGAELLQWAQEKNLIGQAGFSSHGSLSLISKAIHSRRFSFCSLHLHLLDPERLPLAKIALNNGMGVMAISPADKGGHLHRPSQTLIEDCDPFSPIELAYRFLLAQKISTLTLGASKSKDLRLAKKLSCSNGPLNELERASIHRLRENTKKRLGKTYCSQCQECLPCPNKVPIPSLLRLRNLSIGHDLYTFSKERYNLINRAGHWWETTDASACNQCGDCLPRCPLQLPIPDLLKDTHLRLIDIPGRRLWD